jgi:uncharacterized protein
MPPSVGHPEPAIERSAEELKDWFSAGGPTLVALSGGVDSAVVAALAQAAASGRVLAATLVGPAVAADEIARAVAVARTVGIPHELVPVDMLSVEGYRSNPANRCYFCRSTEASALRVRGDRLGIVRYVDGVHRDDLGDDRPGLLALREAGFQHPLVWAGWGKSRVREFARSSGLPNWDTPSEACLASRIPHGTRIEVADLRRVETAEAELRARGYRRVRVRIHGDGAKVEVDPDDLPRLLDGAESDSVEGLLLRHGFTHVTIDPRGYRPRANA